MRNGDATSSFQIPTLYRYINRLKRGCNNHLAFSFTARDVRGFEQIRWVLNLSLLDQ